MLTPADTLARLRLDLASDGRYRIVEATPQGWAWYFSLGDWQADEGRILARETSYNGEPRDVPFSAFGPWRETS